ncbi:hypothetical protein D4764_02G0002330 [Takifugu flavidus]|uniref:Uncharacterized protein n=1 Tax=Takifugu flavidus TaxID=433684 RepID=A0A5C6NHW1_9TELE|nr:hypothetical protein D4764_02G0002330 [Takifugu flavidus]
MKIAGSLYLFTITKEATLCADPADSPRQRIVPSALQYSPFRTLTNFRVSKQQHKLLPVEGSPRFWQRYRELPVCRAGI